MAFEARQADQIAITKSIDRDPSRWRCSITASAYLDNRKTEFWQKLFARLAASRACQLLSIDRW